MHIHHKWSHYLGLGASSLCLIHCLAMPLVTPFLPLISGSHHSFFIESLFVLLVALSTVTIYKGYREHGETKSLILGIFGFLFLIGSLLISHMNSLQIVLSVFGSVLMSLAHYTNYKLCRKEPCCDHAH